MVPFEELVVASSPGATRALADGETPGRGLGSPAAGTSARGGPRARRRQGPRSLARPPRWADGGLAGAPCRRDARAMGVAHGKLGAQPRSLARPRTCLRLPTSGLCLGTPGRQGGAWGRPATPTFGVREPRTTLHLASVDTESLPVPAPNGAGTTEVRACGRETSEKRNQPPVALWGPPSPARKLRNCWGGLRGERLRARLCLTPPPQRLVYC